MNYQLRPTAASISSVSNELELPARYRTARADSSAAPPRQLRLIFLTFGEEAARVRLDFYDADDI